MTQPENAQEAPTCPITGKDFNYCKWAKIVVAIPALPLVAIIAASFFTSTLAKVVAAAVACGGGVYLLEKMDEMPMFAKKIVKEKPSA
jgi:hypothetical protein